MLNLWSMEYHKDIQATKPNSNVCQLCSSNIVHEIVFMTRTILRWEKQISTSSEGHKYLQTRCFDLTDFHSHKLGIQATFMLHWESWWGGVETSIEVIFSGYVLQQRPDTTLLVHQAQAENHLPAISYWYLTHDGLTSIHFSLQLEVDLVDMSRNYFKGGSKCEILPLTVL